MVRVGVVRVGVVGGGCGWRWVWLEVGVVEVLVGRIVCL